MGLPATIASNSPTKAKAAALLLAIGTGRAGSVLEHLSQSEVRALADAVASLGTLDNGARHSLVRGTLSDVLSRDPVAEARALRAGSGDAADIDPDRPFGYLDRVDHSQAVQFLNGEHPQVVAVILSARPPEYASKVLAAFDEHRAGDIALRIATIGKTPPEMIFHIEQALRQKLTIAEDDGREIVDGAKELAAILNRGGRDFENAVLDHVGRVDRELAERVRALMFVFDDILILDDRAIQQVLQNVNSASLALALKGTEGPVKDTILRNLSERARESLLEEIDLLGSVRKEEVEAARTAIVAQIRTLEEAGTITINRGGEDEFLA
jgi:flagellar motor switch protein FliG